MSSRPRYNINIPELATRGLDDGILDAPAMGSKKSKRSSGSLEMG